MNGRYLLDTNIIIALFADGGESKIISRRLMRSLFLTLRSANCASERGNQDGQEKIWLASTNLQPITSCLDVIPTQLVATAKSRMHYASKVILFQKMTFGLRLLRFSMI